MSDDSLARRTKVALVWQFAGRGAGALIQFAVGIVLARLLMPRDFGIMALAMTVLSFVEALNDLGLGQALVQRKDISKDHVHAAFWGTLTASAVLSSLLFLGAELFSGFFKEPELRNVLRVLALCFPVSAILSIPYSLLRRDLDFRRIFFVDISGSVVYGIVGIGAALLGMGVWALVWGLVARQVVSCIIACVAAAYLPRTFRSFGALRDLMGFGLGMTTLGIISNLNWNVDYLFIGRMLNSSALGLYRRAFDATTQPLVQIAGPLTAVLFPAFARLQDEPLRVRYVLGRGLMGTALVSLPLLAVLAPTAPYAIPLVFGQQWTGAVAATQILCLGGLLRVLSVVFRALLTGLGHVTVVLIAEIAYLLVIVGFALPVVKHGIEAMAWLVVAAAFVRMAAYGLTAQQRAQFTFREYVGSLHVPVVAALLAAGAAYLAFVGLQGATDNQWLVLVLSAVMALLVYAAYIWWCPWPTARQMVVEMLRLIRGRLVREESEV